MQKMNWGLVSFGVEKRKKERRVKLNFCFFSLYGFCFVFCYGKGMEYKLMEIR
jgi:hypothetical protein